MSCPKCRMPSIDEDTYECGSTGYWKDIGFLQTPACKEIERLKTVKEFNNGLIDGLRKRVEESEDLTQKWQLECVALSKRVEELEAVVHRLRGHLDHDMLRVLDLKALGGAGGSNGKG